MAMVLSIIAAANGFCWIMSYLRIPMMVTNILVSISDNPIMVLMLINLMLLVLGMLMDIAPLILIVTPILMPVVKQIGMDPVQFGIIIMVNMAIGSLTPPVGSTLFAGCAVGHMSIEKVTKCLLPFYAAMIVVLLLVTYVPAISLTLPNLVMGVQ